MSTPDQAPAVYAGVDIGGTTTQVVLCDPARLTVVAALEVPTPAAAGGTAMVRAALDALAALLAPDTPRLLGVGVGAAGLVDTDTGRILVASDSFTDWAGFPVTATLRAALDVPVFLDNDVNAFLRGEVTGGAVTGEPYVLGMTLGTGVGGALWLDGALFDGPHGAAGEIGHVPGFGSLPCTCGGRGHLETVASGRSVAARYTERTGRVRTALEVAEAADGGDLDAVEVFRAAGTAIARALLITAGVLDITTTVIGGGVSRAWHLLQPAITSALSAEPPVSGRELKVLRSQLGPHAVAVGAASRARSELS
ncbi:MULTISPECIES: ROK family protein [unclassified Streptomyces]|uniref:ROK family protein n=1 Tax=unclassified Streptomyces TaxID=2593676 RepID=UPI0037FDC649